MANIRRARRSGLVLRGGRNVRETRWLNLTESSTTLPAANSGVITNVTGASILALRPFTVIRSRGILHVETDQSAASEVYSVAWGAAVVSDQAVAVGITAVPTPFIDAVSDLWFIYEQVVGSFVLGDATGFVDSAGVLKPYDSRAMRKVEEGAQMVFVAENGSVTANGCVIRVNGRVLIKLH